MTCTTLPPYLHTCSIPTPFLVGPVNVYLAEGEPLTLVDVGPCYDPAREALASALAGCGYRVADLGRGTWSARAASILEVGSWKSEVGCSEHTRG